MGLNIAKEKENEMDLSIVFGSSMLVEPSCSLPLQSYKNKFRDSDNNIINIGKLVIINLQKTRYDKYCWMHIFAPTDIVMKLLMKQLDIEVVYC